jgi:hypothetical protein
MKNIASGQARRTSKKNSSLIVQERGIEIMQEHASGEHHG